MNARYGYVMLLLAAGIWSGCSEENKDCPSGRGKCNDLEETGFRARTGE